MLIKQFINFSIMLDIKYIKERKKEVVENLKKRFQEDKIPLIEKLIKSHNLWLNLKKESDNLRAQRNTISSEINNLKKQGKDVSDKLKLAKEIPEKIKELEEKQNEVSLSILEIQKQIPNIIHNKVPIGKDETRNKVLRKWGKISNLKFIPKNHVDLCESLDIVDFETSAKVSGNGFYFLKGKLAILNQALIKFAIDFMQKKNYTYIEPPLMLRQNILDAAADLETFKNSIYKTESEDLCLIGTSEYSLLSLHINDVIKEEDLPKKYFSYTMCFRKEIGAHGINEKGLWRTHQFNKVEQFIFCKPEDSYKYYEELLKNSEQIIQKLKLPYRVIEMASGALSSWKSKSADIEVYRPTLKEYGEVCTLSNCTGFQARELNIKVLRKDGTREVLHTLNNTAIATSRAMVAILENYQQKDGSIKVPLVLQKYTGFKKIEKNDR